MQRVSLFKDTWVILVGIEIIVRASWLDQIISVSSKNLCLMVLYMAGVTEEISAYLHTISESKLGWLTLPYL